MHLVITWFARVAKLTEEGKRKKEKAVDP